jgi:hypothetical protein
MAKKAAKQVSQARWHLVQRMVPLIEKFLSPGLTVLHDQRVRDLKTKRPRQCDGIVRTPEGALDAIIEVQDREEIVGIQTFEGWCRKRDTLGARRLICATRKGYSKDVLDQADLEPERIVLMTLLEPGESPELLKDTEILSTMDVLVERNATVNFIDEASPVANTLDDKVFEFSDKPETKFSLMWLADRTKKTRQAIHLGFRSIGDTDKEYFYRANFENLPYSLFCRANGKPYKVADVFFVDLMRKVRLTATKKILAYQTCKLNENLALILFFECLFEGELVYFAQTFVLNKNNSVTPLPIQMTKIPGHTVTETVTLLVVPSSTAAKN